ESKSSNNVPVAPVADLVTTVTTLEDDIEKDIDQSNNGPSPPLIQGRLKNLSFLKREKLTDSNGIATTTANEFDLINHSELVNTAIDPHSSASPEVLETRHYGVNVHLIRGKDLAIKDFWGSSDPYVKFTYKKSLVYKSQTMFKNLNPIWDEKFEFFIDNRSIPLVLSIFDYDRAIRDDPMGNITIDLSKLELEKVHELSLEIDNENRTDDKVGLIRLNIQLTPKSTEYREEMVRSISQQAPQSADVKKPIANKTVAWNKIVEVLLVEGKNLLSMDANGKADPYVRMKLGVERYRSKTIRKSLNPLWQQQFLFYIFETSVPPLEVTVWDYDGGGNKDEFMGRGVCQLSNLREEITHKLNIQLEDGAGELVFLVTITDTRAADEVLMNSSVRHSIDASLTSIITEEDIISHTSLASLKTIQDVYDVGVVEVKVYQAHDLQSADINGKSDPFCIVELDNTRLRTHTIYKTLFPVWNKTFLIPVRDIHSVLEITVFDEDKNKVAEFLGKIAIPLFAIKNGERKWYTLKDRKLLIPAKGVIEIEMTLAYGNLKAMLRTFTPKEQKYFQNEPKLKLAVLRQNITRIQNMLMAVLNVFKFINYCFEWKNPVLSSFAFLISVLLVWNFELYMLPLTLIALFARNFLAEYRRYYTGDSNTITDENLTAAIENEAIDDDIDENASTKEEKKSIREKIQAFQDTVLEVQEALDTLASSAERLKNTFNFSVPWLSWLAIIVLLVVTFILYMIPLRYLLLAFVINKFTKRFRKGPDYIDNNEVFDFISRLPSDMELIQYRELKVITRSTAANKKKQTNSKN
ncbi:unnamed protein product, partial [Didymodactylos carnosus]